MTGAAGSEVLKHPVLSVGDARHLPPVRLGVVVKVPRVSVVTDFRHYRRLELLVVDLLPVDILEPPETPLLSNEIPSRAVNREYIIGAGEIVLNSIGVVNLESRVGMSRMYIEFIWVECVQTKLRDRLHQH